MHECHNQALAGAALMTKSAVMALQCLNKIDTHECSIFCVMSQKAACTICHACEPDASMILTSKVGQAACCPCIAAEASRHSQS